MLCSDNALQGLKETMSNTRSELRNGTFTKSHQLFRLPFIVFISGQFPDKLNMKSKLTGFLTFLLSFV